MAIRLHIRSSADSDDVEVTRGPHGHHQKRCGEDRMIGTQAYQCGDDLHNLQAVLRLCLLLCFVRVCCLPETASCKLGPRRVRIVCYRDKAVAVCRTRNRHIADDLRLTLAVHGVFRDGFKARVCSADGCQWHWYKSHGATELSLAKLPNVRQ